MSERKYAGRLTERHRAAARQYYRKHREKILADRKARYFERKKTYSTWYLAHRDELLPRKRAYYAANREHYRAYHAKNRERRRAQWRLLAYGITDEQFGALLAAQEGLCPICQRTFEDMRHRAAVPDHDHDTGKIRGLLCGKCNLGLGHFHGAESLRRAAQYLETT